MDIKKIIKEELDKIDNKSNLNENFYKWFGNSKVVRGGKPLIVYHGSSVNFNVFKSSKSIGNQGETDQIIGMYFTDNKNGASFFALSDDDRYLKSVYLSIENPYVVDDYNTLKKDLQINKRSEVSGKLINLGHDGLIMENGFYANGGPYKLYLTFKPNQIKSVDNDGSWDINDDNIYS
jgi:hypothetical protein